jgi:crotonobetainyl-CoA:carnitine CoA-transferase CaiB-like acyl-CoA transferase
MSDMEGTISKPAPVLDEHTDAVLKTLLRLSAEEIARLRASGAVGEKQTSKDSDSIKEIA